MSIPTNTTAWRTRKFGPFLRGCHDYFQWSLDYTFLRQQIGKIRTAMRSMMREFDTEKRLCVYTTWPGHEGRSGRMRDLAPTAQIMEVARHHSHSSPRPCSRCDRSGSRRGDRRPWPRGTCSSRPSAALLADCPRQSRSLLSSLAKRSLDMPARMKSSKLAYKATLDTVAHLIEGSF